MFWERNSPTSQGFPKAPVTPARFDEGTRQLLAAACPCWVSLSAFSLAKLSSQQEDSEFAPVRARMVAQSVFTVHPCQVALVTAALISRALHTMHLGRK